MSKKAKALDEGYFARSRLVDDSRSAWRRYSLFVLGLESRSRLFTYELNMLLFNSLPGALGLALRRVFFRHMFKSCGKNVNFGRNLTLRNTKNITIGDNVTVDDNAVLDGRGAIEKGLVIGNDTIIGRGVIIQAKVGDIIIGDHCNIGSYSAIVSQGGVQIGEWTQIAGGCKISGGRFKLALDMPDGRPYTRFTMGPIKIGQKCFLGGSVDVIDGCEIGDFSAIGTGAIVMRDIPPYSVFMPHPGMIVGKTIDTDSAASGKSE